MLQRAFLLLIFIAFWGCSSLMAAPVKMPDNRDRCPVCGMFVAPYPEWIATIVQVDGSQVYFDGCKDLFRYYFKLSSEQRDSIQDIYVTEYYRARLLPASDLFYVVGSDVYGPMGKELIPIAGKQNAETFMSDHNGRRILTFDQLSLDHLPED